MGIPFPKIHIATSVMNRLMNAIEGEQSLSITTPEMQTPPIAPDPAMEGAELDTKLAQPAASVDVAPEDAPAAEQGAALNSVMGGSPFDGALVGASGDNPPPAGMGF